MTETQRKALMAAEAAFRRYTHHHIAKGDGEKAEAKFARKFAELGVNKRLVCKIQDTNGVRKAMEKWAERSMPGHFVRYITDCGDGMGGVWLLKDEK